MHGTDRERRSSRDTKKQGREKGEEKRESCIGSVDEYVAFGHPARDLVHTECGFPPQAIGNVLLEGSPS